MRGFLSNKRVTSEGCFHSQRWRCVLRATLEEASKERKGKGEVGFCIPFITRTTLLPLLSIKFLYAVSHTKGLRSRVDAMVHCPHAPFRARQSLLQPPGCWLMTAQSWAPLLPIHRGRACLMTKTQPPASFRGSLKHQPSFRAPQGLAGSVSQLHPSSPPSLPSPASLSPKKVLLSRASS